MIPFCTGIWAVGLTYLKVLPKGLRYDPRGVLVRHQQVGRGVLLDGGVARRTQNTVEYSNSARWACRKTRAVSNSLFHNTLCKPMFSAKSFSRNIYEQRHHGLFPKILASAYYSAVDR